MTVGDKLNAFLITGSTNYNYTSKPMVINNYGEISALKAKKE